MGKVLHICKRNGIIVMNWGFIMDNIDIRYICTVIGNLSGIPIRVYEKDKQTFYYSIVSLPKDPMNAYKDKIFAVKSNVGYYITPFFHFYGIVNCPQYKIVLGPTSQVAATDQELKELAFLTNVPQSELRDFLSAMKRIVQMPYESIMQMLCVVNYVLNGEKLTLEDLTIYDAHQTQIQSTFETERANQNLNKTYDDVASPISSPHVMDIERQITSIVRKGDISALHEWVANAPAVRGGILATDAIRQLKNTFIVTATTVSRAAIRGGMNAVDALALSDLYIQKCEVLNSFEAITNLQFRMVTDFTEHVHRLRVVNSPSKLVTDVANYVQQHIADSITTEDIAANLYLSRPYLSKKFKEQTGENLIDFILREKCEEAKRLLSYTDRPLASISTYLSFSSQSHFTRTFKKYIGISPSEYREKHS